MRIIQTIPEMLQQVKAWRHEGLRVGLVPTMGYLHRGHASLMKAARAENDVVVVSIFVNPTQFGPGEDFDRYPRDMDADIRKAEAVDVDVIFSPSAEEMYPEGFLTYVDPAELSTRLCGASRPGHFRGVCTVVLKLLNLVQPENAYFGQKDAQQFLVLSRMVQDFNLPVQMHRLPIVREQDGLALSSRNVYLSEEERAQAVLLHQALTIAEQLYADGERSVEVVHAAIQAELRKILLGTVEYVEIVDPVYLLPVERLKPQTLIALAVRFGATRLIDNTILE